MNFAKRVFSFVIAICCVILLLIPQSFAVTPPQFTISTSKSGYVTGEQINITYTGSLSGWVGIYPQGATDYGTSLRWAWNTLSPAHNSGQVLLPREDEDQRTSALPAGGYQAVLFVGSGYTPVASVDFTISDHCTIAAEQLYFQQGGNVSISYFNAVSDFSRSGNWIGLYPKGTADFSTPYCRSWVNGTGTAEFVFDFMTGEYEAILFRAAEGQNTVLERIPFQIAATLSDQCTAVYNRTGSQGNADGTVAITPPTALSGLTGYVLYWGDASGKMNGYTALATASAKTSASVLLQIPGQTAIPQDATRLLVVAVYGETEGTPYSIAIPASWKADPSDLLYSFQIVSDLHQTATSADSVSSGHPAGTVWYSWDNIRAAFTDIYENLAGEESIGVFTVGDNVDHGYEAEWVSLQNNLALLGDLPVYFTVGNHEFRIVTEGQTSTYDAQKELFLQYTQQDIYYCHTTDSGYFIHLGSEDSGADDEYSRATISNGQIVWLEGLLDQAEREGKTAFVFLHQPLDNTTSGTLSDLWNTWNLPSFQVWGRDVVNAQRLYTLLNDYGNAVVFTGHGHWQFDSITPMISGQGETANYFNCASAGYLWNDQNEAIAGSQGYSVEVYEDYILVRGREFTSQKWVAYAQYRIPVTSENTERQTFRLKENQTELIYGEDPVTFKFSGADDVWDWIGIYSADSVQDIGVSAILPSMTEKCWAYAGSNGISSPSAAAGTGQVTVGNSWNEDGSLLLDANGNLKPGTYTACFFRCVPGNDYYEPFGKEGRLTFTVTENVPAVTISASQSVYMQGETVTLSYTGSEYIRDWIGIYTASSIASVPSGAINAPHTINVWAYAGSNSQSASLYQAAGTVTVGNNFKASGCVYLDNAGNLLPGDYTACFFSNDGYQEVAARVNFTVVNG